MKKLLITNCLILLPIATLFAQGTPPATPIDGGLSALLVAGGIYGAKKLRDYNKKE